MTELGLQAIYPKPATSQPGANHRIYPYLLRGMAVTVPNQVWSADITYIRLTGGFVYLVAILDWYSRKVLAWRLSNTLETTFCLACLDDAQPQPTPDLQHRSRHPVHQFGFHEPLSPRRDPDQYGWSGAGA